ncbi:MAG: 3-deoxy-manno-octulosonate cytidylyltransferase [Candidatus Omnitrophica bacterium]|nr:3-deoxy-manno-octulosonate cytidylyltransferase [Candidatus Omnitrophota bacterium]
MQIIAVIPARWGSTRFEGKVLAEINGKPMLKLVWEKVKQARLIDQVIIACDDQRVFDAARSFGSEVIMTRADHATGTDRIIEVVDKFVGAEIVINIQADEPLIDPSVIDALAGLMNNSPESPMASIMSEINDVREMADPNVVKVVVNNRQEAMYFSRSVIPNRERGQEAKCYKHMGIYAYRRDFLLRYHGLPHSSLEQTEKLEQLRVLQAGYPIKMMITEYQSIGVDTPEDLLKIKTLLS